MMLIACVVRKANSLLGPTESCWFITESFVKLFICEGKEQIVFSVCAFVYIMRTKCPQKDSKT